MSNPYKIHIEHENLESFVIKANHTLWQNEAAFVFAPNKIVIEFQPFKIKPLLRIDDVLINYWLCDVLQYDHALEFDVNENFWVNYGQRETNEQIKWVKENHANDPLALDRYVGRWDASEIINQIKKNINA